MQSEQLTEMAWEVGADISGWVICGAVKDERWRISSYKKVHGTSNVADAMTKAVDRRALNKYMTAMKCTLVPSRGGKASRAH